MSDFQTVNTALSNASLTIEDLIYLQASIRERLNYELTEAEKFTVEGRKRPNEYQQFIQIRRALILASIEVSDLCVSRMSDHEMVWSIRRANNRSNRAYLVLSPDDVWSIEAVPVLPGKDVCRLSVASLSTILDAAGVDKSAFGGYQVRL